MPRNATDGSVTVFVQGEAQTVNDFIGRIKQPPEPATISQISELDAERKELFGRLLFQTPMHRLQWHAPPHLTPPHSDTRWPFGPAQTINNILR